MMARASAQSKIPAPTSRSSFLVDVFNFLVPESQRHTGY
jgi:hypothetical protein